MTDPPDHEPRTRATPRRLWRSAIGSVITLLAILGTASVATAATSSAARSAGAWHDLTSREAAAPSGVRPEISPARFRALSLDRDALAAVLAGAPRESVTTDHGDALTISLPAPDGSFERFAVQRSSVMQPALAAAHPDIATYSGTGVDDPGATLALDLTPLGLHASVRGPAGTWYVDPRFHLDQSVYASYRGDDLADPHGSFLEPQLPTRPPGPAGSPRSVRAAPGAAVSLRTYRLALVNDPAYATYVGGAANVAAAKATLINRVNQIYEQDLGIHLALVAGNDLLDFDTAAKMTVADGPCGAAACYTTAEAMSCDTPTLGQTRVVLGQLIGASNYDIGHLGMGVSGGGIAYLGVVGSNLKGGGCTGVTNPVGDLFAVDYVAHEMGHQFGANHTFNGVGGSCHNNIAPSAAVEPGSAITIMGYAGICGTDDLQPHSDPYFSQRSIDEISGYVGASPATVDEVQTVSLRDFSGTDSFTLTYNGHASTTITRGGNYSAAGIKAAIQGIAGFSGTVTVNSWDGTSSTLDDTGFSVTFNGGALAGTDVAPLTLTSPSGVTGFVGETTQGGPTRNGGTATATANHAPIVTTPAAFTIPVRTPFTLTGSATDPDNDALTYLWEQNDAGAAVSLVSNTKLGGPLFRVFGTAAAVTSTGTLQSPSPGENAAGTSPQRVFPDPAQIAIDDTNAATGTCPTAPASPPVPAATVDCYSEFLPTSSYAGALHFRLTARDGHPGAGGVSHADTTLTLAPAAGPFRVTSQPAASVVAAGTPYTVTWSVAGTNALPVNVANVKITESTDGGLTFPLVVTRSTPNDGSQSVLLPNANTTHARVKVDAVGNVFFDINHADFTITPGAPVVTNDAPAAGAVAQPSGAPAPVITISATDENSPGTALTATPSGLPAGLALTVASTGPGTPGSRTWTVGGADTAPDGSYPVDVTVDDGSGRAALTQFDVVVAGSPPVITPPPPAIPPAPQPPPLPPPPPPAARVATLAPDLSGVPARLKVASTRRVTFILRCRLVGTVAPPATCAGSVKLTSSAGRHKRTLGTATFSFARTRAKSVKIKLAKATLRKLGHVTSATLSATVHNAHAAAATATKKVKIVRHSR